MSVPSVTSYRNVPGIPTLVMIDEHGQVINMGARSAVGMDLKGEVGPWYLKHFLKLSLPTRNV